MRFRAAIVLGWWYVAPAVAAQPPAPPVPTPVPVPAPAPVPSPAAAPAPAPPTPTESATPPPPTNGTGTEAATKGFEFTLGAASSNVAPFTHGDAKTEEGKIDVTTEANVLKVVMTGGVGANVFLGFESIASQTFQLVQEFEITSADPNVREVVLTLDSGLVGFVRSKHKASACVQLASVTISPAGWPSAPLSASHPQLCVVGPNEHCHGPLGAINKDPLAPITTPPLPLGRYVLQADFVLQATARGLVDAHSTAIFSPEPKELDPWEREHDPYKGEEKEGYGFTTIVTASPVGGEPAKGAWRKHHVGPKVASRPAGRRASR